MEQHSGKLVLAILQGEDYEDTVYELNQNGFFVTMLSSTGGFLKKHSTTIMIGVEEPRLDEVLDILKRRAGTPTLLSCPPPLLCRMWAVWSSL